MLRYAAYRKSMMFQRGFPLRLHFTRFLFSPTVTKSYSTISPSSLPVITYASVLLKILSILYSSDRCDLYPHANQPSRLLVQKLPSRSL